MLVATGSSPSSSSSELGLDSGRPGWQNPPPR